MGRRAKQRRSKTVETITHEDASRRNLPSAEHQPLMQEEEQSLCASPMNGATATWTRS